MTISGQIVDLLGVGVDGVRIDVVPTGGVINADSAATTTAGGGFWQVTFEPAREGEATVDVQVTSARSTYRVPGVRVTTRTTGGEANVIPQWVAEPYFVDVGEVFQRGTNDDRIPEALVVFRRTGGVTLFGGGSESGMVRLSTDPFGRVAFFPLDGSDPVRASSTGEVIGTLLIGLLSGVSYPPVRLVATHVYRAPERILRIAAGPSLNYQGELISRATGQPLSGVTVQFRRTGGVALVPPASSDVTIANGRFTISGRPLANGTVNGELIFTAPPPALPETVQVTLETIDGDESRFAGIFRAGVHVPYYAIVQSNGVGLPGVSVEITRTGGAAITPETYSVTSGPGGVVPIRPVPQALGEIIVDLTFRPPAPFRGYTVRGVRVHTSTRDGPDQLAGVYEFPAAATSGP